MKAISLFIFFLLSGCASYEKKISSDPIQGPLEARYESYRQCYLESESYKGRMDPALGKVIVSFNITKEGKVQNEKIHESPFKDANFHACLLDQIRQTSFAVRQEEVLVRQPFNFIPKQ